MSGSVVHPLVEDDPIAAAFKDGAVGRRLMAAAIAFLMPRMNSPRQRHAVAEEVVAKATARAWMKRSTFDSNRDVCAWLVGFVVKVCQEELRATKRESRFTAGPDLEQFADDVAGGLEQLAERDQIEQLNHIRAKLDDADRELLAFVYDERLTFPDIAAKRGGTAGAWRVAHHRLLKRVRVLLAPGEEASHD
jgi:DNA-directed RNA polymerase specialized sigma24 family protein